MENQMNMALSPDELYDLTHYKQPAAQLRELARLGIPAVKRHDNSVCVVRAHLASGPIKSEPARPQLKL